MRLFSLGLQVLLRLRQGQPPGIKRSLLFSTVAVVAQSPKERQTSKDSRLFLLTSVQLEIHPKDRPNSFSRTEKTGGERLCGPEVSLRWPSMRCHVYFSSLLLSKQDGMRDAGLPESGKFSPPPPRLG